LDSLALGRVKNGSDNLVVFVRQSYIGWSNMPLNWLAPQPGNSNNPFSPLQDLVDDLSSMRDLIRAQQIREGLLSMAARARNASWVNRFLVHAEFLFNPGKLIRFTFFVRTAYSLFMEHKVGRDKYRRWLELNLNEGTRFVSIDGQFDNIFGRSFADQFDPDNRAADAYKHTTNHSASLEYLELSVEFWEASMAWWNMTDGQRQPWQDMCEFQRAQFARNPEAFPKDENLVSVVVHPIWGFRRFAVLAHHLPPARTHLKRKFRSLMARFQKSGFVRKSFDIEDLQVPRLKREVLNIPEIAAQYAKKIQGYRSCLFSLASLGPPSSAPSI